MTDAMSDGRVELVASADLLAEFADVSGRPRIRERISAEDAAMVGRLLAEVVIFVDPAEHTRICRDPCDDYLLALADGSGANYLVTRDQDLLVLLQYRDTQIIYPARFLQILHEQTGIA